MCPNRYDICKVKALTYDQYVIYGKSLKPERHDDFIAK